MATLGPAAQGVERPVSATEPAAGKPRMTLSWTHVRDLVQQLKRRIDQMPQFRGRVDPIRCYGVPRGGSIVAAMVGCPVPLEEAELIVDDIIDSGATFSRYSVSHPNIPFVALLDQPGSWVVFPWEREDDRDEHEHVARIIQLLGEDSNREGLVDTPRRVIKALRELTAGYAIDPAKLLETRFSVEVDQMIVVRQVPFWSLCEHHMLPFHGTATIGYIPAAPGAEDRMTRVVGLSKLARLLQAFARRLQIQERLTTQIADALEAALTPRGVGVMVRARHLCMEMRGVAARGELVTSCLRGAMRDDASVRAEFLSLADGA